VRYLSAKFPDLFLTRDILLLRYQMALVVESGWFETVLWQQGSHLLLKYTESGYETVLTAACARQGCSATEWVSELNGLLARKSISGICYSSCSWIINWHKMFLNWVSAWIISICADVKLLKKGVHTKILVFASIANHYLRRFAVGFQKTLRNVCIISVLFILYFLSGFIRCTVTAWMTCPASNWK
jgi:hypothetical protein